MDRPNIKKYNQELDEKRIKWVENKKLDPQWKKSYNQAFSQDLLYANNLHLILFPIEKYRSKIFNSAFIEYYNSNFKSVEDCDIYKICESFKKLISENELNPIIQKKYRKMLQFEVNMFKINGHQFFIFPAMLKYLNFTLDDLIKTRSERFSLRDTVISLLEYDWFSEFIDFISQDGSIIQDGKTYQYYVNKLTEEKNKEFSLNQFRSIAEFNEILNEKSYKYVKYIVNEHFKFFNNICNVLINSDYLPNTNISKVQFKLIILNFTKLYKLIYKEEIDYFRKQDNIKKTSARRGKSTRTVDLYIKIQKLKEQGYSKTQIHCETDISFPTIRKYWNYNN